MKYLRLIPVLVAWTTQFSAMAETTYEHELKMLQSQRDKAIANSTAAVEQRYQEALKQLDQIKVERDKAVQEAKAMAEQSYQIEIERLLNQATSANDLSAAIKIKQEIAPKNFKFTFLKQESRQPFSKKTKKSDFGEMVSDDPEDVLKGKLIYFDEKSGEEIIYEVASPKAVTKLTYTGAAFGNFYIEIRDLNNKKVAEIGPLNDGNVLKTVDLTLPSLHSFKIVIRDKSGSWMMIKEIKLE